MKPRTLRTNFIFMKRDLDEAFAVFEDDDEDNGMHYENIPASMHPALSELKKMKPDFEKTVEITDEVSQSVDKEYTVTSDFQGKSGAEKDQVASTSAQVSNDKIVVSHQVKDIFY